MTIEFTDSILDGEKDITRIFCIRSQTLPEFEGDVCLKAVEITRGDEVS